jgi:hypothetical protein
MRRFPYMAAITIILVGAQGLASQRRSEQQVNFQRYDSYFEGNDSGLKGKTSYLVFTSQTEFDRVFHPAATMGQNNFLPEKTFDTKLVMATISRGNFLRKYDIAKVVAKKRTILVWYTFKDTQERSARFNSPLILAVDKDNYSQIVFVENGSAKKRIAVPLNR